MNVDGVPAPRTTTAKFLFSRSTTRPRIARPTWAALLRGLNPEQLAAVTLPASPGAHPRRRGLGQDTRADHAHRLADAATGHGLAGRRDGGDLHQQGGQGDAHAPGRDAAAERCAACGWAPSTACATASCVRTGSSPKLPQSFQILDSQDQQSAVKRVIKAMSLDEDRYVPRQVAWFIAGTKEDGLRPGDVEIGDAHTGKLVEIYAGLRGPVPARGRGRLRRAAAAHLRAAARRAHAAAPLPAPLPARAGRRVPGHQPAAIPLAADVRAAAGLGRGRAGCAGARPCSPWATTTRASTPSAAPRSATWPTSSASTTSSA